jgi:indole-3-glycerol phosphate synthase / phosphoribosylanthranilate isomerase
MSGPDILTRIAGRRKLRVAREGPALGSAVPVEREAPQVPFGREPFLICEIKRRSPSKGDIDAGLDPVAQAGLYRDAGVRSVSVLTEEDHFGGSLDDLMAVKRAFPDLSVLRKDFLLGEEDLEVSHRAGADAVLLIAALLDRELLKRLHAAALGLGLTPLVEIHSAEDAAKASGFRPSFTGINSRDLRTFQVDSLLPLERSGLITWPSHLVYESGIGYPEDIRMVREAGFAGVLIGETAVRYPERLKDLVAAAGSETGSSRFWREVARRRGVRAGRPLVKVCGLTNYADADLADKLGADLLGFVFADSPRRADPRVVAQVGRTKALKVGVVVTEGENPALPEGVAKLLADGALDALQFHGDETPELCAGLAFPYYKAVRVGSREDLETACGYRSPRVLLDARIAGKRGGTGVTVDEALAREAGERGPLWLAGGLNAENAADIVARLRPELIDLSSGLESSPGKKDPEKLKKLFRMLDLSSGGTE